MTESEITFGDNITLDRANFERYACNRCGKLIGDQNYTVHIIRHAFDDMKDYESENVIKRAIYDNGY